MSKVKDYKGVTIYVNFDGVFYCDPVKNSPDFKDKVFHSEKMGSVEKAVDNYEGAKLKDGATFYDIQSYNMSITKLKVISHVGSRLFFNDGTNSTQCNRQSLFPESITDTPTFSQLMANALESNGIKANIKILQAKEALLRTQTEKLISRFSKVKTNM